jgi:hypothetical protein
MQLKNSLWIIGLIIIILSFNPVSAINATCTGCSNYTYGLYTVHVFNGTNGTIDFTSASASVIDIVVVAGGGPGANGGAGAGGVVNASNFTINATSYNVSVGRFGQAALYPNSNLAINATNSTFWNLTAVAGGTAGFAEVTRPTNGGSGAGCTATGFGGAGNVGGNGTILNGITQGYNGSASCSAGGGVGSGGGGGATANGTNPSGATGGNGGEGQNYSAWFGTTVGYYGMFASGGGGGGDTAGSGGPGAGDGATGANNGGNAINGTGSGGGGTRDTSAATGGHGSTGVIIIRYLNDPPAPPVFTVNSITPANNSFTNPYTRTPTFIFNLTPVDSLTNLTLFINNINSGTFNNYVTNNVSNITSTQTLNNLTQYQWKLQYTQSSSIFNTSIYNLFVTGGNGTTTTSCVVDLGDAIYIPNDCAAYP